MKKKKKKLNFFFFRMCILPIQNTHQKYLAYSTENSVRIID